MSDAPAFGQWLKQRRKSLDITQEQLADLLSCSPATIYKIEAGTRRPSRQVAQLLARGLRVYDEDHEEFVRFARSGSGNGRFAGESRRREGPGGRRSEERRVGE